MESIKKKTMRICAMELILYRKFMPLFQLGTQSRGSNK